MGQMFFSTEFPNRSNDFHVLTDKFLAHCAGKVIYQHIFFVNFIYIYIYFKYIFLLQELIIFVIHHLILVVIP